MNNDWLLLPAILGALSPLLFGIFATVDLWLVEQRRRDSGSRPTGRDVKQARGEARQSGGESRIAQPQEPKP